MLLFSRYEYNPQTDLIGKGGFSRVYKALDKKLNRWLALKVYRINELDDRYSAVAEIQRVIHMDHPNICRYIDIEEIEKEDSFGEKEMIQVCVMELMDAGELRSYYNTHGKDNELFKKLLKDVLRGLSYLHKNGVIHRDIKPANILIKETVEGPVAKITDFGISKNSNALESSTSSALIVSIPYMAPEQLNAKKYGINEKISYNIDFWSLGVAVYEILTGDVLFKMHDTDSREQVMNNIMQPELPEKIRNLPQPFRDFVAHCIVKDAKERVQQADELLLQLDKDYSLTEEAFKPAAESELIAPEEELPAKDPEGAVEPDQSDEDTQMLAKPASDETVRLEKPEASTKELPKPVAPKMATAAIPDESVVLFHRYEYNPGKGLIGKGGFSRVYKAYDNRLSRWVALKIYKPGEFSEHYSPIAEIRRVINLDHSNICRYLDMEEVEKENSFGEKEKTQICVMELLDGGNFAQYYKEHPGTDILKKLLNDVLNGLSYLHKNGIIHRDIKPANILIKSTIDGPVAKITDFGISKKSDSSNVNTSSALIVSIPYMAPEQLNPNKYGINEKISFNLDLWSLGVTIYEVITGKILFKNNEQDTPEQIMANIMQPDLPDKINELPQPFRNIVSHCLIKDAKERAQKAEELIVLLHGNFEAPKPAVTVAEITEEPAVQEKVFKKNSIEEAELPPKPSTSLFLENSEEAKPQNSILPGFKRKPAKIEKILYFSFAGVAAILIFLTLFRTHQNKVPEADKQEIVAAPAVKKDSIVHSAQIPTVDSSIQSRLAADSSQVNAIEKPKTKDVADVPRENTNKAKKPLIKKTGDIHQRNESASAGNNKYILELSTNESCTLKINDIDYGLLDPGKGMKVYLVPGKYILTATSKSSAKVYSGDLVVLPEYVNLFGQFKIKFN